MQMSANEQAQWAGHLQTPIIFNHHAPVEINSTTIQRVDLNPVISTPKALANEERVLILTPLRNAAPYIEQHFDLLSQLTYPHNLIDLAFLVGDSTDDTLAVLAMELERVQSRTDKIPFRSAMIVEKDFGVTLGQDVEDRHGFAAQGPRRKAMGKARNYLLSAALKPDHSWVYWRDVDIKDSPNKIIEDFVAHDRDVLVPSKSCSSHSCEPWLMNVQTSGSTATRTAATSRAASITTRGRNRRPARSSQHPLTEMLCLQKVRPNMMLLSHYILCADHGCRLQGVQD